MFNRFFNPSTDVHTVQTRAQFRGNWYAFHATAGEVGVLAALWLVWIATRMTRFSIRRTLLGPNAA